MTGDGDFNWEFLARRLRELEIEVATLRRRPAWPSPGRRNTASACDTIRFTIISSDQLTLSALVQLDASPPGCNPATMPGIILGGTVAEVCDPTGCFFNEPNSNLIGRRGWAKYMLPNTVTNCNPVYPAAEWEVFSLCCALQDCTN